MPKERKSDGFKHVREKRVVHDWFDFWGDLLVGSLLLLFAFFGGALLATGSFLGWIIAFALAYLVFVVAWCSSEEEEEVVVHKIDE